MEEFDEAFGSKEECCLKVLKSYTSEVKKKLQSYEENMNSRQRLSPYLDDFFDNAEDINLPFNRRKRNFTARCQDPKPDRIKAVPRLLKDLAALNELFKSDKPTL